MVYIEMLLKMMRRWLAKRRVNLRQWLDSEPKTAWEYAVIGFFLCEPGVHFILHREPVEM